MRILIVGIVIASLWATPVTAELRSLLSPLSIGTSSNGAACDRCESNADACCETTSSCMICRPKRILTTVEIERWSVCTEPACVSWCKWFSGLCRSGGCTDCCAQGPNCRCSRVRPRNRLLRLKEARYVPTVVHFAEAECRECSCCEEVAGVQLQGTAEPSPRATATENVKIYWIDGATQEAGSPLGTWTDSRKETKPDEIKAAKVHWLNALPASSTSNEEASPIYRVSDLPAQADDTSSPVNKTEPDPSQNEQETE